MQQMRNLGYGKFAIEQQIKDNIGKVIDRIELATDNCVCGGQLFSVDNFGITSLLFGDSIDHTDASFDRLQEAISNAIRSLGQVSLLTFFPQVARQLAHFKLVPFINQLKANFVLVNTYIKYVYVTPFIFTLIAPSLQDRDYKTSTSIANTGRALSG